MAAYILRHYSVLSGLVLFSAISVCNSIATGNFSTGLHWLLPIGSEQVDSEQTALSLLLQQEDALSPLGDDDSTNIGSKDYVPTPLQLLIVFGFLAVQQWVTTMIIVALAVIRLVTKETLPLAQFAVNMVVILTMLIMAGASVGKAVLLTLTWMFVGGIFVVMSTAMLGMQIGVILAAEQLQNGGQAAAGGNEMESV